MIAPLHGESEEDFLGRVAQILSEHFDVVQIFTQTQKSADTAAFHIGSGNVLARLKQLENWIEMMNAHNKE